MKRYPWTPELDEFLQAHYTLREWTPKKIADHLGFPLYSVHFRAKKLKIQRYNSTDAATYTNPSEMTPTSAYILGFLWADGYSYRDRYHHTVHLQINSEDANSIRALFGKSTLWSISKLYSTPNQPTWKPFITFGTSNIKVFDFLISKGFAQKSIRAPSLLIDAVPKNFQHYWWRGYSDGDGCFSFPRRWCIAGSYGQDWSSVIELLSNLQIDKYTLIRRVSKKGHRSSELFVMSKSNLQKLGEYIYPNGWDDIGLKRKFDRWKVLLQKLPTKKGV